MSTESSETGSTAVLEPLTEIEDGRTGCHLDNTAATPGIRLGAYVRFGADLTSLRRYDPCSRSHSPKLGFVGPSASQSLAFLA